MGAVSNRNIDGGCVGILNKMVKTRKKRDWKKIAGIILIVEAILTLTPPFFMLPTDLEFWFLFLIPFFGVWVLVVPFILAVVMFAVGMLMLGLPLNGKGVKKAVNKVKLRGKKKK